jgi:hypothetical protein
VPFAIIDTSVYVNHWEGILDDRAFSFMRTKFIVRQSSVVISELRRGARTPQARRLVENLRRLTKIQWTPTAADWWQAAVLIQKIGDARNWDRRKRQAFQNDTLIALFELLAKEVKVRILFV